MSSVSSRYFPFEYGSIVQTQDTLVSKLLFARRRRSDHMYLKSYVRFKEFSYILRHIL